jgi:fatty-acid desaturase
MTTCYTICSYAATRGMLWAHMGWIFFKSKYERLSLVDREDLDRDEGETTIVSQTSAISLMTHFAVVRLQHKYYGVFYHNRGFSMISQRMALQFRLRFPRGSCYRSS